MRYSLDQSITRADSDGNATNPTNSNNAFDNKRECMPASSDYAVRLLCASKKLHNFVANRYKDCFICRKYTFQSLMVDYLNKKYRTSIKSYNVKVINDIIYNENTHIVSVFKDYLIFDDVSEFMRRFYNSSESSKRLPKIYEFYEKYSKVFPNYVTLPENKYMFKNIEKKQKLIDELQKQTSEKKKKKPDGNSDEEDNMIFDASFLNKLNKAGSTLDPSMSGQSQLHSYIKNVKSKNDTENSFQQLIDKVLSKDSLSFYQEKNNTDHKNKANAQFEEKNRCTKNSAPKKPNAKKEELIKEIKIQLPLKKEDKIAYPATARDQTVTSKAAKPTEKKITIPLKDYSTQRKAETPLKLFATKETVSTPLTKDTRKTDSKAKGRKECIPTAYEQKRAHSSNKSPKPKLKEVDFQKMMSNIKMLQEYQPSTSQAIRNKDHPKGTGKHLSVEPKCRYEKIDLQSRNPNPPQQSCTNKYSNMNDIATKYKNAGSNFILDIDISNKALINSSRKANVEQASSVMGKKSQQSNHYSSNNTPEINRQKVESLFNAKQSKNPINQPQTVKALLDNNRMLFSKSVASVDKAKNKMDSKTPCQSDKKDANGMKIVPKKVTQKNIFTPNMFQPQLMNSKK